MLRLFGAFNSTLYIDTASEESPEGIHNCTYIMVPNNLIVLSFSIAIPLTHFSYYFISILTSTPSIALTVASMNDDAVAMHTSAYSQMHHAAFHSKCHRRCPSDNKTSTTHNGDHRIAIQQH